MRLYSMWPNWNHHSIHYSYYSPFLAGFVVEEPGRPHEGRVRGLNKTFHPPNTACRYWKFTIFYHRFCDGILRPANNQKVAKSIFAAILLSYFALIHHENFKFLPKLLAIFQFSYDQPHLYLVAPVSSKSELRDKVFNIALRGALKLVRKVEHCK